jgi:hypothetical protein
VVDIKTNLIRKKKLLTATGFLVSTILSSGGFFFSVFQDFERYAKDFYKKVLVDLKGN